MVITRASHQVNALSRALEEEGARPVALPLLEVVPPDNPKRVNGAARSLRAGDWLVFTSSNTVRAFLPRVPPQALDGVHVAAVGPATRAVLDRYGIRCAAEAERPDAEGLLANLAPRVVSGQRVLLPQADDARPLLAAGLRATGAKVETVVAYCKRLPPGATEMAAKLFDQEAFGWVTFTSPRIVRHFIAAVGESWKQRRYELRALSIGPVTTSELRRQDIAPAAQARVPTAAGMVQAMVRALE